MDAAVVSNRNGLLYDLCGQEKIPAFVVDDLFSAGGNEDPGAGIGTQGLVAQLKEFSPEVIHCHDLLAVKSAAAAADKIMVPCVITAHTGMRQAIGDLITARKLAVVIVFKSEFEVVRKAGLANIDFHYVPNGTRASSGMHRQGPPAPGPPNLVLVGNLGFRKGIDVALLAMVELRRRRGPGCPVLNIYGSGELGEYFAEMAGVLRLDDVVKFHGLQMDVLNKCPSSDVLIVPSRDETGPLVVIEAMSRGMPIVACSVGDVVEMLPDRRYGRVVPVNSIAAFAGAIDSMLTDIASGRFNPDLLIDRHRSQYSIETMADRMQAVYQSAMLGG
jgi:glycosyltransferase involved in cell wall biosynthesis